jgi:hypothetical protein
LDYARNDRRIVCNRHMYNLGKAKISSEFLLSLW